MKTIKQKVYFDVGPKEVYEAYTEAKRHAEFTQSKVIFEKRAGGKFSAWDGDLSGENLELVEGEKIVQKWRANDWQKGHYSTLTIELYADGKGTKLVLTQENVPDDKYDDINSGWNDYYWEPMKKYFKK